MVEVIGMREMQRILELTDRLGVHRELIVVPLAARHPGRARRLPNGKIEIVVEAQGDFEQWVDDALEPALKALLD